MNTKRKAAIIVGILYIIGTVSGILSLVFTGPVRNAQDLLITVSANESRIITGAFFVLIMGLSLAMVPVIMYSTLKKHNEALALGYVVFRGGLESVTYIATVISWLLLLPLSHVYVQTGSMNTDNLQALGTLLLEAEAISPIATIVFSVGAFMFYYVLYQSRLVPRWLSGWGLLGLPLFLANGLLDMFTVAGPFSTVGVVIELPLALQEMVLAVWLIFKGFNPSVD